MVEGDIGMEGELLRRADIVAHLLEQPVGLLGHRARQSLSQMTQHRQ